MEEFTVKTPGLVYLRANKSFSGCHGGMWYRLSAQDGVLRACVWPLPWCFEKTDEAEKTYADFSLDADGLSQAGQWVQRQYRDNEARWRACPTLPPAEAGAHFTEAPSPAPAEGAPSAAEPCAPADGEAAPAETASGEAALPDGAADAPFAL